MRARAIPETSSGILGETTKSCVAVEAGKSTTFSDKLKPAFYYARQAEPHPIQEEFPRVLDGDLWSAIKVKSDENKTDRLEGRAEISNHVKLVNSHTRGSVMIAAGVM